MLVVYSTFTLTNSRIEFNGGPIDLTEIETETNIVRPYVATNIDRGVFCCHSESTHIFTFADDRVVVVCTSPKRFH